MVSTGECGKGFLEEEVLSLIEKESNIKYKIELN